MAQDRAVAEDLPDVPAARHHPAIATVCLSGTLEDKLAAAAAARFHGIEIFEHDLVASPWSPRRVRQECARRGLSIDALPAVPRLRGGPARRARGQPAPGRAQVRRARAARRRRRCWSARRCPPDAVDDDDLAAEQLHELADRARAARAAHRLRGAGVGPVRQHLRARVADRPARRPSRARPVPRQLPRAVPRRRPGRDQGRARRQGVPRAAGRRAAAEHGRGRVEPAPPAVPRAWARSTWPASSATC